MTPFRQTLFNGWSTPNWATFITLPLSGVYRLLSGFRSVLYAVGIAKSHRLGVPVVVVGNISVGGTGKTPLSLALIDLLIEQGYKPGVISRGYGGKAMNWPQVVKPDSNPHYMGDEAVLMAAKQKCPVVVGPVRVKAAQRIIDEFAVDIIVSDDGLQHKALGRDIEIAVVDMQRQHKNLFCLPAGPLREPVSRLGNVDLVVQHRGEDQISSELLSKLKLPEDPESTAIMRLRPTDIQPLLSGLDRESHRSVPKPAERIHAVAGIGHPQRFFNLLRSLGYDVVEHAFEDHHEFTAKDFKFSEDTESAEPIVMTEKDAVKCTAFAEDNFFYLPVSAELNETAEQRFIELLNELPNT